MTEICVCDSHISVKTTLELDDALHARAKAEAARRRISLTRLVEESLRRQLDGDFITWRRPRFKVKPRNLEMKPAFRQVSMNKLAARLEDESLLSAANRGEPGKES